MIVIKYKKVEITAIVELIRLYKRFTLTKTMYQPNNNMELTRQERKMLIALSSGKLYKEIASENFISINTVKKHLKNVYKKLHVSSRKEAVEKYARQKEEE